MSYDVASTPKDNWILRDNRLTAACLLAAGLAEIKLGAVSKTAANIATLIALIGVPETIGYSYTKAYAIATGRNSIYSLKDVGCAALKPLAGGFFTGLFLGKEFIPIATVGGAGLSAAALIVGGTLGTIHGVKNYFYLKP